MYFAAVRNTFYSVGIIIKKVPSVQKKIVAPEVAQICDIMSYKHRGW
jgi:hypothetical protein